MSSPRLSTIVPTHNGAGVLPLCLAALRGSDLPRPEWELIVVNDASTDATAAIAAPWADQVLSIDRGPRGPAFARNRGVEVARGEWVVFIDADVVVHADTLRRFLDRLSPGTIAAVFGAYDDSPPAPGFLSVYRSLLHRYVHLGGAGAAQTFWAGCGAVRRSVFLSVGGFDERRFRRPQIEDIELGYRLRDRGFRVELDPEIQGAHLKQWPWLGSLRTDLLDRGVPWIRLLLERPHTASRPSLNIESGERFRTVVAWIALLLLVAAGLAWNGLLAAIAAALILGIVLSNYRLYGWFAAQRGWLFALGVIPMNLTYYLLNGIAVGVGVVLHVAQRLGFRFGSAPEAARTRGSSP